MKSDKPSNDILQRAIEAVHAGVPDADQTYASEQRVWQRIRREITPPAAAEAVAEGAQIEGCSGFRALLPAYLAASLAPTRELLLKDHLAGCVACRHVLQEMRVARQPQPIASRVTDSSARSPWLSWRLAVLAVAVLIAVALFPLFERLLPAPGGLNASVQAAEGHVVSLSHQNITTLHSGSGLSSGQLLRTGTDGHARVRLGDGSQIEINRRSQFFLSRSLRGTTIHLQRGSVIVQAAHQSGTHLYVATPDALISVTGTIFAVDSGTKGSRVAVIQGEVHVNHLGRDEVLHPGDETTTEPSLGRVSVGQDVAWSDNAAHYAALLAGFTDIRHAIDHEVSLPGMRYSSRLLDYMPPRTVFYAALPNLSAAVQQSYTVMEERIQQNPALQQWWQSQRGASAESFVRQASRFGNLLGDEIAISAQLGVNGQFVGPLILAESRDSSGLRAALESENAVRAARGETPEFELLASVPVVPASVGGSKPLLVWMNDKIVAASPEPAVLRELALRQPAGFSGSPFGARIDRAYQQGAGILVAADLRDIVAAEGSQLHTQSPGQQQAFERLGITALDYMIADETLSSGHSDVQATLGFEPSATGIPSWLASPGPMGTLDYISPDANLVAAFVVKNPQALARDLVSAAAAAQPDIREQLEKFRDQHGIDIERDVAAQLGGEVAFAVDGPILPTPAWKAIFEVNDPAQAENTIERIVDELNRDQTNSEQKLHLQSTQSSQLTVHTVNSDDGKALASYAFFEGYLVVAPTPAFVLRAVQSRQSGSTIQHSPRFTATLPAGSTVNFSALLYHDFAPVLQAAEQLAVLTPQQRETLSQLAAEPPTLLYANADNNQISFAAAGHGSLFGLTPAGLLGMPNSFEIQNLLEKALHQQIPE